MGRNFPQSKSYNLYKREHWCCLRGAWQENRQGAFGSFCLACLAIESAIRFEDRWILRTENSCCWWLCVISAISCRCFHWLIVPVLVYMSKQWTIVSLSVMKVMFCISRWAVSGIASIPAWASALRGSPGWGMAACICKCVLSAALGSQRMTTPISALCDISKGATCNEASQSTLGPDLIWCMEPLACCWLLCCCCESSCNEDMEGCSTCWLPLCRFLSSVMQRFWWSPYGAVVACAPMVGWVSLFGPALDYSYLWPVCVDWRKMEAALRIV